MGSSISTSCFGRTLCGACTRPEQWLWKWGMSPKCGFWIILMRSGWWSCEFRGIPSFGEKLGISLNTKRTLGMCEGPRLDVRSLNKIPWQWLANWFKFPLMDSTMIPWRPCKSHQVPKTCQATIGYIHCMIYMHIIWIPAVLRKASSVFPGIGFSSVAMAAMGVAAAVAAGGAIGIITYQTSSDGMCRFFFYMFFFCNLIIFRLVPPPKKNGND